MNRKIFIRALFCNCLLFGMTMLFLPAHAAIVDDSMTGPSGPSLTLNSFLQVGVNISKFILGIVGALTLAMFVYGGIKLLISGGSTEEIKKGKDTLVAAVIGLAIVFGSYTIINFVVNNVFQAKVTVNNEQINAFNGSAPEDLAMVCGASATISETCIGETDECKNGAYTGQIVGKKCAAKKQKCCQIATCGKPNGACVTQEQCSTNNGRVLNVGGCTAALPTCCVFTNTPE